MTEKIKVVIHGDTVYSVSHPDRAAVKLPFDNFAIYRKEGDFGVRVGVCSSLGAFQWLKGDPVESLDEFYYVNEESNNERDGRSAEGT